MKNSKKEEDTVTRFLIALTIGSVILIGLRRGGYFAEEIRIAGFCLFTLLCIAMAWVNRNSKMKIAGAIGFFAFGLIFMLQ